MSTKPKISLFSKHLFWDVNRGELDIERDKYYIIKQVLEYGSIVDWNLIQDYYGIDQIGQISTTFRDLDAKTLSFISTLSNIPLQEFRCYTYQQSIPQHWNF